MHIETLEVITDHKPRLEFVDLPFGRLLHLKAHVDLTICFPFGTSQRLISIVVWFSCKACSSMSNAFYH